MADAADAEIEARVTALRAAADQESAEWEGRADRLVAFWATLREGGMPKNLAGHLTIVEQAHANELESEGTEE